MSTQARHIRTLNMSNVSAQKIREAVLRQIVSITETYVGCLTCFWVPLTTMKLTKGKEGLLLTGAGIRVSQRSDYWHKKCISYSPYKVKAATCNYPFDSLSVLYDRDVKDYNLDYTLTEAVGNAMGKYAPEAANILMHLTRSWSLRYEHIEASKLKGLIAATTRRVIDEIKTSSKYIQILTPAEFCGMIAEVKEGIGNCVIFPRTDNEIDDF